MSYNLSPSFQQYCKYNFDTSSSGYVTQNRTVSKIEYYIPLADVSNKKPDSVTNFIHQDLKCDIFSDIIEEKSGGIIMPSWGDLLQELQPHTDPNGNEVPAMSLDDLRMKYLSNLYSLTGRNVIAYYSGWLKQGKRENTDINDTDITGFMNAINGLDCSKGLDLLLHTPGGNPTATEGIVKYLHKKFGNDIRVIVPQMAMSAGTMLACSAKSILMGSHSYLGPIDPQFAGIPAYNVVEEFNQAKSELINNPKTSEYWKLQFEKYPAAFLYTVIDAINLSAALAGEWLMKYMFENLNKEDAAERTGNILSKLNVNNKSHARHFSFDDCESIGLIVERLEDHQELQEAVLSAHHAFIITLDNSPATKIIENHFGKRFITSQRS